MKDTALLVIGIGALVAVMLVCIWGSRREQRRIKQEARDGWDEAGKKH